jgi:uncharacterized DUF497 family protein
LADAVSVFSDALAITIPDEHFDEERFVTMGRDGLAGLLNEILRVKCARRDLATIII